jgi:hypothetical protein
VPTFRAELRSSRRLLRRANVTVFDLKNDGEVAAVLATLAKQAGVKPSGHTLKLIDTSGRRWKTVKEVTG